jgi:hypothetical protein
MEAYMFCLRLHSRGMITLIAIAAGLSVLSAMPLTDTGDRAHTPAPGAGALTPAPPSKVRIGTYDGRALAIAFVPMNKGRVAELLNQAKEAQAAGDVEKLAVLRANGSALQTVRHLQAFGNAPVDDILDRIRDKLPDVARRAGVCAIVREPDFRDDSIETIDVTDQLVALFDPEERTLKLIKDVREHKPMTLEAVLVAEREEHKPAK